MVAAVGYLAGLVALLWVLMPALCHATTDADCRAIIPKADAPSVMVGNLCSSQYGPCVVGSHCGLTSGGCRCVSDTSTTTTTPTTSPATTSTIATGCQTEGKQVTSMLPTCCPPLQLLPKSGTSGLYCQATTVTTIVTTSTTRPPTTTTTIAPTTACSVTQAGKACNAQALCCSPLLCIPNPNGSDYCGTVSSLTPTNPTPATYPLAACRPSGIALSARWADGSWLNCWMDGVPHPASNAERDCLENALKNRLLELIATAGDLAPNAANKARDCRTLVQTRIGIVSPYEGALQTTNGGLWFVPPFGRHYQCEQHTLNDFRNELMGSSKRALAAARFGGPGYEDLRNLLDVNPTFSGPAAFPTKSCGIVTTARANAFQVDTRTTLPPCANGDCSLLHATHEAHACVTNVKCGLGLQSACPLVGLAHTAYENGCHGDERCLAFRKMKPFSGFEDHTHWTPTQICQLSRLQDREHLRWMAAQERGDWKASRKADANHDALHQAMNDGDDRTHYTYSCDTAASDIIGCFGGDQPMSQLLPKLVAAFGVNG
jgi:hypothetical protein